MEDARNNGNDELLFFSERLKSRIGRLCKGPLANFDCVPGLTASYRTADVGEPVSFYTLSAVLVLQGRKDVRQGGLVATCLKLDPFLLCELVEKSGVASARPSQSVSRSFCISKATSDVVEAFDRLVQLVEDPSRREMQLGPAMRDIHYLLCFQAGGLNLR